MSLGDIVHQYYYRKISTHRNFGQHNLSSEES
jgi:hypothetical protein